ncbi:hypothetical protein ACFL1X_00655 [Candidatus Hydrogenedentota bacterium]
MIVISSSGPKTHPVTGRTNADGKYRMTGLHTGTAIVATHFKSTGAISKTVEIEPGVIARADFALEAGTAQVEGWITLEGRQATKGRVELYSEASPGDGPLVARASSEGFYRIENVPDGSAKLKANATTASGVVRSRLIDLNVSEGEVLRKDVDLTPTGNGSITGYIEGITYNAQGGIKVISGSMELPEATGMEALMATVKYDRRTICETDWQGDGTFQVDGLEPGTYSVVVAVIPKTEDGGPNIEQARIAHIEVKIESEEPVVVEFDFR